MPTVEVVNQEKKKVGTLELPDSVFASKINVPLVHQVIKAHLAGLRQGTAKTKVKREVRGGGKKPFRQKGTGNARQGSSRSPLNPGGGQNFGPTPRSYEQATPRAMVRGALRSVLSDRLKAGRLVIVDQLKFDKPSTKGCQDVVVRKLGLSGVLIVDDANPNLELSARNLRRVDFLRTDGLNAYEVVRKDWLLLTREAAQALGARLSADEEIST